MHTQLVGFLATAVAKPAVFLLAHISLFGPAILLILLVKAATSHSAGIALFTVAALAMILTSESRFLTFAYPILVTLLCLAFRDLTLQPAMVAGHLAAKRRRRRLHPSRARRDRPPANAEISCRATLGRRRRARLQLYRMLSAHVELSSYHPVRLRAVGVHRWDFRVV
jgi:hypothetical protein